MGDNCAIVADGLSKRFRLGIPAPYKTMRDAVTGAFKNPFRRKADTSANVLWALKDVSFEVKKGQALGIIGGNGAGKSTLLKVLSRIIEPTTGRARIRGRLASLLEVGTGFHPELTGRENVFLSGAILGMKRAEIQRKFDEIMAFAETDRFVDTPVKFYSSGMYVRLAFAVAAHMDPDILLVDEVLAVGDAAFQKKCLNKMGEGARSDRTVLFVSHNLGAMSALTTSCLYLKKGRLVDSGDTASVIQKYLSEAGAQEEAQTVDGYRRDPASVNGPVHVTSIHVNSEEAGTSTIEIGSDFSIFIELEAQKHIEEANVTVVLKDAYGQRVVVLFSWDNGFALSLRPGRRVARLDVHGLPLAPGRYYCDVGVNQTTVTVAYDVILDYPLLEVVNRGQAVHWLDRPWGGIHWSEVEWKLLSQ